MTGADANIIPATKRPITKEGIDFGFVGDVNTKELGVSNFGIDCREWDDSNNCTIDTRWQGTNAKY
ncbi:MAG: hypothetical protein WDM90_18125 [Ferruginibacter sp.]